VFDVWVWARLYTFQVSRVPDLWDWIHRLICHGGLSIRLGKFRIRHRRYTQSYHLSLCTAYENEKGQSNGTVRRRKDNEDIEDRYGVDPATKRSLPWSLPPKIDELPCIGGGCVDQRRISTDPKRHYKLFYLSFPETQSTVGGLHSQSRRKSAANRAWMGIRPCTNPNTWDSEDLLCRFAFLTLDRLRRYLTS